MMKFAIVNLLSLFCGVAHAQNLNSGFVTSGAPSLSSVRSPDFGILWQSNPGNSTEEFMSPPVVYNSDRHILLGSSLNKVYTMDALTGTVIASRQLRDNSKKVFCADLRLGVGILGAPILDKEEKTAWVYAKSDDGYYLHSFDVRTLKEQPGFPVHVDGLATDGSESQLNSTMLLQRPALSLINGVVYGAFGGGCEQSFRNMSGWVVGINAVTGKVISRWSSDTGIWQQGRGLSNDRSNRLFLAVADGEATSEFEGSVVHLEIQSGGALTSTDMFKPWNYSNLERNQRDMGSSSIALTDFIFQGRKTAVAGGMNGVVYVLDRDNLGGYQPQAGRNKVLQEWAVPSTEGGARGRLGGGVASWPQKGGKAGWLYMRPSELNSTLVYSFNEKRGFKLQLDHQDVDRRPTGSGSLFVSVDSKGEGVLWVVDMWKGLLAWNATPPKSGNLISIPIPKLDVAGADAWTYKFQPPVFAGGKVYVLARQAGVVAYGKRRK